MIQPTRDKAVPVKGKGLSLMGQKSIALKGVPSGGQLLIEDIQAATHPGLSISISRLSLNNWRNHSRRLSQSQGFARMKIKWG
jgi:hypothetical protein